MKKKVINEFEKIMAEYLVNLTKKNGGHMVWGELQITALAPEKDILEGVEYVEYIGKDIPSLTNGKIYLRDLGQFINLKYSRIGVVNDDQNESNGHLANLFKPSTESAYVDQLQKGAFEKYGEIKEVDRFDISVIRDGASTNWKVQDVKIGFKYIKDIDALMFGGIFIYQSGKWATKLPKRVEVFNTGSDWGYSQNKQELKFSFDFRVVNGGHNKSVSKLGKLLAQQLEKYLNNEIEKS